MILIAALLIAFTLISAVGLYLAGNHFASRRVGVWLAVGDVVFFVLLSLALWWMALHWGG